jgi:hypothetical protein
MDDPATDTLERGTASGFVGQGGILPGVKYPVRGDALVELDEKNR